MTPRTTASVGRSTSATMSRTPTELNGTNDVPTTSPLPVPAPTAPAPPPAPAPAPGQATKTIHVCPDTFTENAQGICAKPSPTPSPRRRARSTPRPPDPPILDSYETPVAACPGGYNFEDYGWVKYCRKYGTAPTKSVKDATPTGYTDTGTEWSTKDAPPTGYVDNGTAWVTTTAKIANVVPA